MSSTDTAKIIRFPIEKRLGVEMAREKIGKLKMFKYPDSTILTDDVLEWVDNFLIGKKVLLGWSPINKGVVDAFKQGNVCHVVSVASSSGITRKPFVEVCCKGHEQHFIHNWRSKTDEMAPPAALLSIDQSNYFRTCLKCESYLRDHWDMLPRRGGR